MKKILNLSLLVSILIISGCVNDTQEVKPYSSSDCTEEIDKFKKYQECINNYILRVQECTYFYRSGEDIVRNTKVEKCIKERYPKGRESCNSYKVGY